MKPKIITHVLAILVIAFSSLTWACGRMAGDERSHKIDANLSQMARDAALQMHYKCVYFVFAGPHALADRERLSIYFREQGTDFYIDEDSPHASGIYVKEKGEDWARSKVYKVALESKVGIGDNLRDDRGHAPDASSPR